MEESGELKGPRGGCYDGAAAREKRRPRLHLRLPHQRGRGEDEL